MLQYNRKVEMHSVGTFQVEMHSDGELRELQSQMHSVDAFHEVVSTYSKLLYNLLISTSMKCY